MYQNNEYENFQEFRHEAERRAAMAPEALHAMSPEKFMHTVHELQVHQIELDMQNENLRAVHAQLDAVRARYFDLYELAPVGYLTVSEKGLILEPNLTAVTLLGITRKMLINRPMTQFILEADQDIYYRHRKQLFGTGAPQSCELRMLKGCGEPFWARLDATAAQEQISGAPVCRVVMIDLTERKQAEEKLNAVREEECVRVARELHDELGQVLTALKIDLTVLEKDNSISTGIKAKVKVMQQLLDKGLEGVQSLCLQLRPGGESRIENPPDKRIRIE
jgi:PAS domain S-box-containing protein